MFSRATEFEGRGLENWKTGSLTGAGLDGLAQGAISFNPLDLSGWDVSGLRQMHGVFASAEAFEGNGLEVWNTANVQSFGATFSEAKNFNADISQWSVSKATNMAAMFAGAERFDQDLSMWDVSLVEEFNLMFVRAAAFNQDLSSWNVSSGTDFSGMFERAGSFNQNLCMWGPLLAGSTNAEVTNMFGNPNQCETTINPNLNAAPPGPFCSVCT